MAKSVKLQEVTIDLLKPYERNAKIHPQQQVEKIVKSIEEFGFVTPCVIDSDYNLIAGHGRVRAAKEMGLETVPCVFVEGLTEEQRKAYILADNRLGELGEWDMDIVFGELEDLQAMDFDIEVTGFEMPEEIPEVFEDDFEPVVPAEPRTKLGDLWKLGSHRLICGDSTDVKVIDRLMDGVKADIAFTSPPYNAGKSASLTGNTHMTECKYENGDDNLTDYDELLIGATDNMLMFSKWAFINLQMLANNKVIICEWLNNYKDFLCDIAIWYKNATAPAMAERVMNSQFEFIFIFGNDNNSRAVGTKTFRGTVSNVYQGSAQRKNEYAEVHSATFPVEFVSHFVSNFTEINDVVLDCFGGTGTTLIACEQLNRKCYMCELDPKYVDVIVERWENFTGKKAVLING